MHSVIGWSGRDGGEGGEELSLSGRTCTRHLQVLREVRLCCMFISTQMWNVFPPF